MPIRGITFDLDGTLADTLPVCYAAFRSVFLEYTGRRFTNEEIHALFGPCEKGAIRRVVNDWQAACDMYWREYETYHKLCERPFAGITELLDDLAQKMVRVAVVTGKGAESAEISLRRLGLADRFELVEAGSPEGAVKADAIRRILDLWSLTPGEMLHVGDAPTDIQSAKECGVHAVGAAWAPGTRSDLLEAEHPENIFPTVSEFRQWLISDMDG